MDTWDAHVTWTRGMHAGGRGDSDRDRHGHRSGGCRHRPHAALPGPYPHTPESLSRYLSPYPRIPISIPPKPYLDTPEARSRYRDGHRRHGPKSWAGTTK
eukprot:2474524-Rhodomonas_salina.2